MKPRDLVIVGGGAGGLVVASVASQLGLKVTLIEQAQKLGGDCLHFGCVPSKTLIKSAYVASLMRRGADFGLDGSAANVELKVDLGKVNDHVQSVIDHIQQHDDPERFRSYGCEVLLGEPAEFVSPHEVRVGKRQIRGKRFVIATGTHPSIPPIPGLAEAGFITNLDLFALRELPKRLLVIGGGPIGVEMGQALARLGSQVTLLQRTAHLLPQDDPELTDLLRATLEQEGMAVHTSSQIQNVFNANGTTTVECTDGLTLTADKILVATGRQPNIDGLGLAAAGVTYNERGIGVDRRQRTSQKHIYACGDVCGPYAFTHMAEYQAGIVISNAVFRFPKRTDYRVVPRVTYTDPELAQVGQTEQQVREQSIEPTVLRFPFKDIDRALTEVDTNGLTKLITHKGKILGASILGPHAGELIHEIVLAMQAGAKIGHISSAIHAYPTLSQIHRRAVNTAYSAKLFSPVTRRLVTWINRLLP